MKNQKTYVCLGTCQALITEEQYENGLTKCGAEVCTFKDNPFVIGVKCEICGKNYQEGSGHAHNQ